MGIFKLELPGVRLTCSRSYYGKLKRRKPTVTVAILVASQSAYIIHDVVENQEQ